MRDLTELEYLELFTCAREVAAKFQQSYHLSSFQFVMHDGELAGDDIPGGLCLQAIPNSGNAASANKLSATGPPRESQDMEKEVADYSRLFEKQAKEKNAVRD